MLEFVLVELARGWETHDGHCFREHREQTAAVYGRCMTSMLERLRDAMDSHDARRMASLFAEDYLSAQPVHQSRGFGGRAQVFENWSSVFEGVPDFASELEASSVDGQVEWGEWHWHGHHADGAPFAMRGVTILVVHDDLVTEARLYMEPVEVGGADIEAAVEQLYKPPSAGSPPPGG